MSDDEWDFELPRVPLKFSDSFERLPADAPPAHAHIIDFSSYNADMDEERHETLIWNSVVTMLHKISVESLEQFLDSEVSSFRLVHKFKSEVLTQRKLLIWRRGCKVLVGQYRDCSPNLNAFEWDNMIRCVINHDGSWKLKGATFGKYTSRNLMKAWNKQYVPGPMNREQYIGNDESAIAEYAMAVGDYILHNECWDATQSSWVIKTS